jgi:hypothetical protein
VHQTRIQKKQWLNLCLNPNGGTRCQVSIRELDWPSRRTEQANVRDVTERERPEEQLKASFKYLTILKVDGCGSDWTNRETNAGKLSGNPCFYPARGRNSSRETFPSLTV